jgi:hypothetical protein
MSDRAVVIIVRKFARQTLTFGTWFLNYIERRAHGEITPEIQEFKVQLARLKAMVEEMERDE